MTRYTSERGYGLDLSGPEPVWRGRKLGWNEKAALRGWGTHPRRLFSVIVLREDFAVRIPRYRIDDYIKRGLIDPARRDDL